MEIEQVSIGINIEQVSIGINQVSIGINMDENPGLVGPLMRDRQYTFPRIPRQIPCR
jgi:hypothetical protein